MLSALPAVTVAVAAIAATPPDTSVPKDASASSDIALVAIPVDLAPSPTALQADPVQASKAADAKANPPQSRWKFGGAIRARYDLRFNDVGGDGARRTSSRYSFDTLLLTLDYDSPVIFGAAQYRFYGGSFIYGRANGYENYPGEVNFPVYAYVGAKLNANQKVAIGLQPVPFDDRWWGSAFFNSLGFAYGMEEVYNAGVTFTHAEKDVTLDLGYFPTTAPNAFGISDDSARFSVNIVKGDSYVPDAARNAERNMFVGRVQYLKGSAETGKLTLTASAWLSTIHNFDTRDDGHRRSFALSAKGEIGPWHAKLLAARQEMDPRNGTRNDLITVGDYDSSYNIAAKGTLIFSELGRKIDTGKLPFNLNLYANYARFLKDGGGFETSERLTLGAFWSDKASGKFRIWSDLMIGRNDPYVGAGQFLSGAAQGADNSIKTSLIILMGYYF